MSENVVVEHENGSTRMPADDRLLVKWLENEDVHTQMFTAQAKLDELLLCASQPRHASVNACIKLCYFVEQCMASEAASIRGIAFSSQGCVALFNFYIDWSEKNQSRSMRQVLELVSTLVSKNPDSVVASEIKSLLVERILSVLSYEGSQALVKPAFRSLEYFLGKKTVSLNTFIKAYGINRDLVLDSSSLWDVFLLEVFDWMNLAEIAPIAGKFLVTVFRQIGRESTDKTSTADTASWQKWIRAGLRKDPQAIENVKNYIFLPLFRLDRSSSLVFLTQLNELRPVASAIQELDDHSLFQLAAIEVGKKAGLVEEPVLFKQATKKTISVVALKEETISDLLSNASDTVRTLAFSVMVSSSSPIRPFSAFALSTLESNLGTIYADTEAKFRNEVLSNTKHMINRLRGASAFLVREIKSMKLKAAPKSEKSSADTQMICDLETLLSAHKSFVEWIFMFLLHEIIPTTSYQRHSIALKAIELLLRSGILHQNPLERMQKTDNDSTWPFQYNFFTPNTMRLLLDLLMDPFEEVRSGASLILKYASVADFAKCNHQGDKHIFTTNIGKKELSEQGASTTSVLEQEDMRLDILQTFIHRAENASKSTGRADYADGVARSNDILYNLQRTPYDRLMMLEKLIDEIESKLIVAESDLGRAVLEAPVHGQFAGLSLVWDSINYVQDFAPKVAEDGNRLENKLEKLQQRAVDQCSRIWAAVKDILCDDSPEGYLLNGADANETVDTKDILSYSFRAIHESSNLMRTMVNKLNSTSKTTSNMLSTTAFAQIGNLTFEQLSSLRHRGAFATVTLTFFRCCASTQLQGFSNVELLGEWYQGALDCIFEQVSTTRRSAGIPALLTGIMAVNAKEPAFQDIMKKLKSIARQHAHQSATDETNLPQVHAMNSLKETFKSSVLGKRAESHIEECLQIAVDSLKSEIWAIRNCGLLLLRSLIDCLFGTSDSKQAIEAGWDGKSIKISYDKYPTLPKLLLKLLGEEANPNAQTKSDISTVESVFPALDIVRRAGPPSTHRNEIYSLVKSHLGSRVWNVREMAAHAMSVLVPQESWAKATKELLESQHDSINKRHGSLLAVKFIIERQAAMNSSTALEGLQIITPAFISSFPHSSNSNCPEIFTAYFEAKNAADSVCISKPELVNSEALQNGLPHPIIDAHRSSEAFLQLDSNSIHSTWHSTCISLAKSAICGSMLEGNYTRLTEIFQHALHLGADVVLAALSYVPGATLSQLPDALLSVCSAYISVVAVSTSSEIRATALEELFDALTTLTPETEKSLIQIYPLLLRLAGPQSVTKRQSPAVHNAELQMSGWLLLANLYQVGSDIEEVEKVINAWAGALSVAGKKTEEFDTRMAAVLALDSFYAHIRTLSSASPSILFPAHMVLYDCLNDDDSEIRDVAAQSFSTWTSQSLVPLAAQQGLARILVRDHANHPLLLWNVVSRLTGSLSLILDSFLVLESPKEMFKQALNVDNTLFVEEDQNLYIDEVREVHCWKGIFDSLFEQAIDKSQSSLIEQQPVLALAAWTAEAIDALGTIDQQDWVFGWTSKSEAFSACVRTIETAKLLLESDAKTPEVVRTLSLGEEIDRIRIGLEAIKLRASKVRFHESLLVRINEVGLEKIQYGS